MQQGTEQTSIESLLVHPGQYCPSQLEAALHVQAGISVLPGVVCEPENLSLQSKGPGTELMPLSNLAEIGDLFLDSIQAPTDAALSSVWKWNLGRFETQLQTQHSTFVDFSSFKTKLQFTEVFFSPFG